MIEGGTIKNIALFFAAPFVGLAYILAMPLVGLGLLAGQRALGFGELARVGELARDRTDVVSAGHVSSYDRAGGNLDLGLVAPGNSVLYVDGSDLAVSRCRIVGNLGAAVHAAFAAVDVESCLVAGNDTVRGWREYDSIYHSVFACLRGSVGYPKGHATDMVPQGLLLRL